jgi:uncharacterized membrane protein SpoIIM required for sporulation
MLKQLVVLTMSFSVFFFSSFVMYSVWTFLNWRELLPRGLVAFLAWIISFSAAARILWKTVEAIQPNGIKS